MRCRIAFYLCVIQKFRQGPLPLTRQKRRQYRVALGAEEDRGLLFRQDHAKEHGGSRCPGAPHGRIDRKDVRPQRAVFFGRLPDRSHDLRDVP